MAKGHKDQDGKSALDAAFHALEAGDVVTARRTAQRVISAPTAEDQAAVRRVGRLLHGDDDEGDAQAELLAGEIVRRTRPALRPYLWAAGGVAAYALLLVMAVVRYG